MFDSQSGAEHEKWLIARVAHDLRSPLTAIKTSVGVVLANQPPDFPAALGRMLRNIELATDQMADVIADAAELAQIHDGTTDLTLEPCDLAQVIERTRVIVARLAERRELSVVVEPGSAALTLLGDGRRLERALANLGGAVARRAPMGSVLTISLAENQGVARIGVATGPIDEFIESRPDADTTPVGHEQAGQGAKVFSYPNDLGLQVARAIVERHGGQIWLSLDVEKALIALAELPLRRNGEVLRPTPPR